MLPAESFAASGIFQGFSNGFYIEGNHIPRMLP